MCDKAVDSCLLALKFVPDCFVKAKMIEKLDSAVFPDDYIVFSDLDPGFVTLFSEDIGLNSITIDNINLDDDHFDFCDPKTINHVTLMGKYNKHKQPKASKKIDEELLPVAWHPERVWDWCMSVDEKRVVSSFFIQFKFRVKLAHCT